MSGKYTKAEAPSEEGFRRKAAGETNREIDARFGLSKAQVKWLVRRQNRTQRLIANGYAPQPKGRTRKGSLMDGSSTAVKGHNTHPKHILTHVKNVRMTMRQRNACIGENFRAGPKSNRRWQNMCNSTTMSGST